MVKGMMANLNNELHEWRFHLCDMCHKRFQNLCSLHKHRMNHFFKRDGAKHQVLCYDGEYICRACPVQMDFMTKQVLK